MKLYVGRPDCFNIVDIDKTHARITKHNNMLTENDWGFAWHKKYLYSCSEKGLSEFTTSMKLKRFWPIEFQAPHQISAICETLYICEAHGNTLAVVDLNKLSKGVKRYANPLGTWINSVSKTRDRVTVVSHNKGKPSTAAIFNIGAEPFSGETVEDIGFMCHNCWEMDNQLWTLSSWESEARTLDGSRRVTVGGFPRGIAGNNDMIAIGVTRKRKPESGVIPDNAPENRDNWVCGDDAGIALFDRSMNNIGFINLGYDKIWEVRLIGEPCVIEKNGVFNIDTSRIGTIENHSVKWKLKPNEGRMGNVA